jgi:2-iminobutanoate/2-iminopropanoate deaminase
MREARTVPGAVDPIGPYSHAVIANGFVFVSGQGPANPQTGEVSGSFREQARQTLENIRTILHGVDLRMQDVVKVQVFLSDLGNFPALNEVYREFFPKDYPVRTTVGAQLLDIMVEIDCVAALDRAV